jgi:hypothetical protein
MPRVNDRQSKSIRRVCPAVYVAVYHRSASGKWPEDAGDDPSFGSAFRLASRGGVLTWGVCRQDVRNRLCPGDLVVFFSADRVADRRPNRIRYSFVAFATVARKVSQADIWRDASLAVFRDYLNLLIRPSGTGFEHFEPGLSKRHWHGDWYWRIAEIDGHRKGSFKHIHRKRRFELTDPRLPQLTSNYVLFARDHQYTLVLAEPPIVATAAESGGLETWKRTPFARKLLTLLRTGTMRRLRTSNIQRPHRHITITGAKPGEWRQRLRALCQAHGFKERRQGNKRGHNPVTASVRRRSC